ncbi:MAG: ATPase [Eubacteriales bacterium]|nr:ATPase [Eubacteriales bacterium]
MQTLVVGWDGGGTKTSVVCLTLSGEPFAQRVFGSLNQNGSSLEAVCATVSQAVSYMLGLGRCVALVISVAGISNPETTDLLCRLVAENGYHGALQIVGDHESALQGAVGGIGAILVSGTGSICFGRNQQGQTIRSGGFGYLVDDEGSGYAIGRDILTAVLRAHDGRIPPTMLTALVTRQEAWHDIPTIMHTLYHNAIDKATVASLAPLILQADGDAAASAILQKASGELTLLATTVIDRLHLQTARLALMGGILTHIKPIRFAVETSIRAQYSAIKGFEPMADAAQGAAQMALAMDRKDREPHA